MCQPVRCRRRAVHLPDDSRGVRCFLREAQRGGGQGETQGRRLCAHDRVHRLRRRREGLRRLERARRHNRLRGRGQVLQERGVHCAGGKSCLPQPPGLWSWEVRDSASSHRRGGEPLGSPLPPPEHAGVLCAGADPALRHVEPLWTVPLGGGGRLPHRPVLRHGLLREVRRHRRRSGDGLAPQRRPLAAKPQRWLAAGAPGQVGPLSAGDGVLQPGRPGGLPRRRDRGARPVASPLPERLQLLLPGVFAAALDQRPCGARVSDLVVPQGHHAARRLPEHHRVRGADILRWLGLHTRMQRRELLVRPQHDDRRCSRRTGPVRPPPDRRAPQRLQGRRPQGLRRRCRGGQCIRGGAAGDCDDAGVPHHRRVSCPGPAFGDRAGARERGAVVQGARHDLLGRRRRQLQHVGPHGLPALDGVPGCPRPGGVVK
mmetsp:Transcript_72939/g.211136  ORF Transcript_72939/g.211136 Transcript_72939/m.211136 type:complete len:429 (-) Transcript_72939:1470-2756(-)